jgi:putative ABC transport system permease protein
MDDGRFQQVILLGLDDQAPVGAPMTILRGRLEDLAMPDAVIMDERGAQQLWPDDPYRLGRVFEMNDRRAVLVGICTASRTFQTFPVVYTRYSRALAFSPPERKMLSFILAEPKPGLTPEEVALDIKQRTGLAALTRDEFRWKTIDYYLQETGIPINFGITVLLGLIVGTAITGQTFYLFTVENLKQFGALKAMGASDWQIVRMILVQAALVSFIGYGLGVGGAALFGELTRNASKLAFFMPWQVLIGTGVAVFLMAIASSLLCIVRVLVLEPAVVFRG